MTTKFTPGPWKVFEHSWCETSIVTDGFDHGICALDINHATEESQEADEALMAANARLIAAAPELYQALDDLFTDMIIAQGNMRDAAKRDNRWEGCAEEIQPRIDAARAALAKARGAQ